MKKTSILSVLEICENSTPPLFSQRRIKKSDFFQKSDFYFTDLISVQYTSSETKLLQMLIIL